MPVPATWSSTGTNPRPQERIFVWDAGRLACVIVALLDPELQVVGRFAWDAQHR
jgi:hypothetical protein